MQLTVAPPLEYDWLSANLLDRSYTTKLSLPAGTVVRMDFDEPVTGLYLIWDLVPGPWTLRAEDWTLEGGQYEMIHEYAELPGSAQRLELTIPGESVLCDVYAFTEGRLPAFVQTWLPPADGEADFLLFPTHGDDDLLFFGGTMPYYAGERGLKVQVVYVTNHWNEPPRPHEQINGMWEVGVRNYPVVSPYNDVLTETLEDAQRVYGDDFRDFQVRMIRRFRPLVIIGHDTGGEYGHGAHRHNALSLIDAVPLAADPDFDPDSVLWYGGTWDTPKLYLHLYPENRVHMDWDVPLARFGGRTAFEMAQAGYRQHLSQQHWSFHIYAATELYSCYDFGLVRSTVGDDVEKNDFLENIPPRGELPR